jgi:protein-S-isoprenylcysteine O-methyltransferase Ste14
VTPIALPELVVRATSLYLPITIAIALAIHLRPGRRRVAGALLATVWNLAALLAVNLVAVRAGWWSLEAGTACVAGVPADPWVGWALLWGAVPVLATTTRMLAVGIGLVAADVLLMPLAEPVVVLEPTWLIGEAVAVVVCLIPGLLLGRWTATDSCLAGRAVLQVVAFASLLFFVVPTLAFTVTGEGWARLADRPRWAFVLAGVLLALVGAMALQAVREFVDHGGTPVPLDPPTRLVTTGPYAYIANPMQTAGTILLALWGVLLGSSAIVAAAVMAAVFSAGLAAWNEDSELGARFGDEWYDYRQHVRRWFPSWRPSITKPAAVYAARSCEPCSQVGDFLTTRHRTGLDVTPAEECPVPIQRITYEQGCLRETGIAAIGRSLEHVNLAWAAASWVGRLPGVVQILQLITDTVVGGPRSISQPSLQAERAATGAEPWPAP